MKEIITALFKLIIRPNIVYWFCVLFTTQFNPLDWALAWKMTFAVLVVVVLSSE